jgi:hypothetical protein
MKSLLGRKVSDECTVSFIATVAKRRGGRSWASIRAMGLLASLTMNAWARLSRTAGTACCYYSISVIASKTRQILASMLIVALVPFHDQTLILTGLSVVWVRC